MSTERNPSPPPDGVDDNDWKDDGDRIGSTAFSKKFVLRTLFDLVKETQIDDGIEDSGPAELQESLDADLCQLWDMTADREVARFVADVNGLLDIFLSVIKATNKPRLTELLAGILANLMCVGPCLQQMTPLPQLRESAFLLFNCRDTPTLVETSRLLTRIAQSPLWTDEWEESFEEFGAYDDILFVLSAATSNELLLQVAKLMFNLMQVQDSNMSQMAADSFVKFLDGICDGLTQCINDQSFLAAAYLFMSLSVLCDRKRCALPQSGTPVDRLFQCIESAIDAVSAVEAMEWTSDHVLLIESCYATINDFSNQFSTAIQNASFLEKTKSLVGNMTNMLKSSKDDEEMKERCSECLTRIRTTLLTLPRDVEASSLIDSMARYIL